MLAGNGANLSCDEKSYTITYLYCIGITEGTSVPGLQTNEMRAQEKGWVGRSRHSFPDKSQGSELHHLSRIIHQPAICLKAFIRPHLPTAENPHLFPMSSRLLRPAFRTFRASPFSAVPISTRQFTTSSPKMTVHILAT